MDTACPRSCPSTRRGLTLAEFCWPRIRCDPGWGCVLQSARLLASIRLPLGARQLASDLILARATAVLRNTRRG